VPIFDPNTRLRIFFPHPLNIVCVQEANLGKVAKSCTAQIKGSIFFLNKSKLFCPHQDYTSRTSSAPRLKTRMSLVHACSACRARSRRVTLLSTTAEVDQQNRRCPTETRTSTAAMAAAAHTGKPKTSPKSIKFLFGGLAGYVCAYHSAALCCIGLNWMSNWWESEIIDKGHPLSAARASDQNQHKEFMWCVMAFLVYSASSVVNGFAGPEKAW